ncbi:N-acetylmuramoyl-L-alanine amidase [Terrabacter sp. 2RAF25]|uniref:N-acetylmuramoyl-L-alanine amidase n=1 Tax=Terrabacter sp. 2RAF25 TaxID=3232998 RepID=UPI003F94DE41
MRPHTVLARAAATTALAVVAPVALAVSGPLTTAVAAAPASGPGTVSGAVPGPAGAATPTQPTAAAESPPVTPTVTRVPIPAVASPITSTTSTTSTASSASSAPSARAASGSGAAPSAPGTSDALSPRKVVAAVSRAGTKFDVLGVTYQGAAPAGLTVEARTHTKNGWSGWIGLDVDEDHGPDAGTAESRRARVGTDPLTAAGSDGAQVRVLSNGGAAPRDLALSLVDAKSAPSDAAVAASPVGTASTVAGAPNTSAGTAPTAGARTAGASATAVSTASAASVASVPQPTIVTRAQWGADESMMPCQPDPLGGFKAAVVHHTVNANTYTAAQAPGLVRGIFAYHTQSHGWCDIGYNFLVDRFGRIYEGRKGGLNGFTQGAQAGGFNSDTLGVSVIGDFTNVRLPSAVTSAVSRTIAWQADRSGFNPASSVVLTSGGSTRYDAGVRVTKPRVMGHRDLSLTSCPGDAAYPQVASIRSSASSTWRAYQYVAGRSVYVPVTARRLLDTRTGLGTTKRPLPANTSLVLTVPGLPSTATAVTLNVTALDATAPTTLTAYPANMSRRLTANLDVVPGRTITTQVTVGVAPGGTVRLFNARGAVNVAADLEGYFRTGTGAGYAAYTRPSRLVDTRTGVGAPRQQVSQGRPVTFTVPGLLSGTRAVSFNVTVLNASGPTSVTAYRAGSARPAVPSVSVTDRTPVANLVTIPADQSGRVTISVAQGQADVVIDALGFYVDGRGLTFVPVAPRRLVDTRVGWGVPAGPLAAGRATTFGIPNTTYAVRGAALAVGGISTANGWVSFYPSGQSPPATSTLSTVPGRTITNLASTATTTGSLVNIYNSAGSTQVIVDLMGYYTG